MLAVKPVGLCTDIGPVTCGRIPDGFVFGLWFARSSATLRDVVSGVILQAEALDFAVSELEELGEPDVPLGM